MNIKQKQRMNFLFDVAERARAARRTTPIHIFIAFGAWTYLVLEPSVTGQECADAPKFINWKNGK